MHQEKGDGYQRQDREQTGDDTFENIADHEHFLLLHKRERRAAITQLSVHRSLWHLFTFAIATIIHEDGAICKFISQRMHKNSSVFE